MKKVTLKVEQVSVRFTVGDRYFFLTPSQRELILSDEEFREIEDQLRMLKDFVDVEEYGVEGEGLKEKTEVVTELEKPKEEKPRSTKKK